MERSDDLSQYFWEEYPESAISLGENLAPLRLNRSAQSLLERAADGSGTPRKVARNLVELLVGKGLFITPRQSLELRFYGIWLYVQYHVLRSDSGLLVLKEIGAEVELRQQLQDLRVLNSELKEIVETSADGLVCVDQDGIILRLNHAYEKILGIDGAQFLGKPARMLVEKGHLSKLVSPLVIAEKKPQTVYSRIKNRDVLISGHPVFNEHGEVARVIANIRDLTELNRLKDEVGKFQELATRYEVEIHHLRSRTLESEIIGHSEGTRKMIAIAEQAAKVDSTVLIYGETGTGKEILVKAIHKLSKHGNGPFIAVNCSTIPESLMESELFGYEAGAFTGSDRKGKIGLFEAANGGTMFLDEISDMPLAMQAKLLRVIQERAVRKIGASTARGIEVRLIAASNRRLESCVEEGKFRADLFYRLNIIKIDIPPLRNRKEDIPLLANTFLHKFNEKFSSNKTLAKVDMDRLLAYDWPGNIRELRNVIERFVVLDDAIDIGRLLGGVHSAVQGGEEEQPISCLKSYLREKETEIIRNTYGRCLSTRKTAEALKISQSTVVRKLRLGEEAA